MLIFYLAPLLIVHYLQLDPNFFSGLIAGLACGWVDFDSESALEAYPIVRIYHLTVLLLVPWYRGICSHGQSLVTWFKRSNYFTSWDDYTSLDK